MYFGGMKIKNEFRTRQEAVEYLEKRGWMTNTIFPSTGTVILSSDMSNSLRGVRNVLCGGRGRSLSGKWIIDRDQTFLRGL